ncbi:5-formyltetrahydrofolate cyclo-ligase [Neobacillus cucumis]|nr:5-formyltetrahydrofolate cyclo-ligase [Neobacillus cucumis]
MNDKKVVRTRVKESLQSLGKTLYEDYSHKIARTLFEEDEWKTAKTIGIYISRKPEVDTYQIIRRAWDEGKQVVVPKCNPIDKTLSFRTLTDFSQLESVYYGLWEPIVSVTNKISSEMIDLIIVPGLAYTRDGFRLGFGGGFYDRFLSNYSGKTLSLAFHLQIIPHFPVEKHDIPVSKIITDQEVIKAKC